MRGSCFLHITITIFCQERKNTPYMALYNITEMLLPMNHLPLVREGVKLPIEFTHGDGFGVKDGRVHGLKRDTSWSALALQS